MIGPGTHRGLPQGRAVRWDHRARRWQAGALVAGGAPWGLVRLAPVAQPFVTRLATAGPGGVVPATAVERATADRLVERGIAHPVVEPVGPGDVTVVVPAHERTDTLARCLSSLAGMDVVVVDDASPNVDEVAAVAARHDHRLVRRAVNGGPGAARNTGLAATDGEVVAFLDSDCVAPPGWVAALAGHFDDPRVAAVAPRVRPPPDVAGGRSLLARHEDRRSALDMGDEPQLVRRGAPLGFLPSAALLVRRSAVEDGFDEALRLGEDVDLIWRLADAGWHARYDPSVTVHHEMRSPAAWARRRFDYGTSAAVLDRRHPGRLAPVNVSGWNVAVAAALSVRRPRTAAAVGATAVGLLGRRLAANGVDVRLAGRIVGTGLVADAVAIGHALRREWWPLGWLALARSSRSPVAAAATAAMVAPIVLERLRPGRRMGLVPYTLLRLGEDALYGTGVLTSAVRARHPAVMLPRVRWPGSARQD